MHGTKLLRAGYKVFNNRTLDNIEARFASLFELQKSLYLFPKNFSQWVEYIILVRERERGIDSRIIEQEIMERFIQLRFLKQGAQEKGVHSVYDFLKRKIFF